MFYYKYVTQAGTNSEETISTILTSTEIEPKHIDALCFIEITATENLDAVLRAYIENVRVLDMPYALLLAAHDVATRLGESNWIPIEYDLPVGQELKVGCVSGATLSNFWIAVRYRVV